MPDPTDDEVFVALACTNLDTAEHQTARQIAAVLAGVDWPDDDLTEVVQSALDRLAASGRAHWAPAYGAFQHPTQPTGATLRSLIREAAITAPGMPEGPALDAIVDHFTAVLDGALMIRSEVQ